VKTKRGKSTTPPATIPAVRIGKIWKQLDATPNKSGRKVTQATNKRREAKAATESIRECEQLFAALTDYDNTEVPVEPEYVEHFVSRLQEWRSLADNWRNFSEVERESAWGWTFSGMVQQARNALTRLANTVSAWPAHSAKDKVNRDRYVLVVRVAAAFNGDNDSAPCLIAMADGFIYGQNIWGGIIRAAFAAKGDPGYLDELCIAQLRGDLLLAIAIANYEIALRTRAFAEPLVDKVKTAAAAHIKGGALLRNAKYDELKLQTYAGTTHIENPKMSANAVAIKVCKATDLSHHTLRKRNWFKVLMNA
jgi:hypothetical protein